MQLQKKLYSILLFFPQFPEVGTLSTPPNKPLLLAVFLLAASLAAFAEGPASGAFVGIGPEAKSNTRSGMAIGGSIVSALDLNAYCALGQKTSFLYDMDAVSSLELQGFFRYMPPLLRWPTSLSGPFAQAEAGGVVFFYQGEAFPAFSGGLAIGWRFVLPNKPGTGWNWYVEPSARGGYPCIWGAGIAVGIRYKRLVTE